MIHQKNMTKPNSSSPDPIFKLVDQEDQRQHQMIGLIPSENQISPAVLSVLGSSLNSKYSEGMVGHRYYEGNQFVDQIEQLARDRIRELFDVAHVNVQPYSGSPANSAIYFALMEPGDTLMGLKLSFGGHLTHGHPKVTFSGKFFNTVQFGLNDQDRIDFDQVRELALEHKPKVIVAGNTAYPFELDFAKFREIADEVGAWLVADISHVTGLVLGGRHPSPVPHCDVIMSTTHKTFRGPRGAMILVTKRGVERDPKLPKKIDSAIIPGLQGGPHNATTAGIAIAAAEAARPEFQTYIDQVRANADALAAGLLSEGLSLVGGGTETHLLLIDLTKEGYGLGTQVAFAMDVAGMYANRNTVPHEPCSPFYPSGIRLGTPLVTSRGMKEKQMKQIATWIAQVVAEVKGHELPQERKGRSAFVKEFRKWALQNKKLTAMRADVVELASKYPLFQW
jgi:glycine hydroxymethyltransferase